MEQFSYIVRKSEKDFILRYALESRGNLLDVMIDVFGKSVSLTENRLEHILERPEMNGQLERIKEPWQKSICLL